MTENGSGRQAVFPLASDPRLVWISTFWKGPVKLCIGKLHHSNGSMKYIPVVIGNALSIGIRFIACFAPHESE